MTHVPPRTALLRFATTGLRAAAVAGPDDASEPPAKAEPALRGRSDKQSDAASEDVRAVGGGPVVTRAAKRETYKAHKGDTLAKIADRLGADVAEVKRLNH